MVTPAECNVVGCVHAQGDCEIVRCATCGEPYDGSEAARDHIARVHEKVYSWTGGNLVEHEITNFVDLARGVRVFLMPDGTIREEPTERADKPKSPPTDKSWIEMERS